MKYRIIDKNIIEVRLEKDTDIFILYNIIEKDDIIEGYDYRVIKFESGKDKKKIYIKLKVEDIKFSQYGDSLRISGKIIEGDKDLIGHYHTFDISLGSEVKIIKNKNLTKFQIKQLENSNKINKKILLISLDNKEVSIADINENSYNIFYNNYINYSKEDFDIEEKINVVYSEINNIINNKNPDIIIIIGPIFYPEKLYNFLKEKNKNIENKKVFLFKVTYGGENGIYEFLRRKEYLNLLKEINILNVNNLIEEIMENISKGKVVLGYDNVKNMLEIGNLEYILFDINFYKKIKEEDPNKIEEILKISDKFDIDIYFVYPSNNYYEFISKFGIVGKLRYNI